MMGEGNQFHASQFQSSPEQISPTTRHSVYSSNLDFLNRNHIYVLMYIHCLGGLHSRCIVVAVKDSMDPIYMHTSVHIIINRQHEIVCIDNSVLMYLQHAAWFTILLI